MFKKARKRGVNFIIASLFLCSFLFLQILKLKATENLNSQFLDHWLILNICNCDQPHPSFGKLNPTNVWGANSPRQLSDPIYFSPKLQPFLHSTLGVKTEM